MTLILKQIKIKKKYEKLFVFDIDGTIRETNGIVSFRMKTILKKIIKNHRLSFASGKSIEYITGFCRALKLKDAIIIAENGAIIRLNSHFPPIKYYKYKRSEKLQNLFLKIKTDFTIEYKNKIRFQQNHVNLTIFPNNIKNIKSIHNKAKNYIQHKEITTYFHCDCVEFIPAKVNKGKSLEKIMKLFNITKENVYAFGNGENDIPLFEKADNIIIIGGLKTDLKIKKRLASIEKLEKYLETILNL